MSAKTKRGFGFSFWLAIVWITGISFVALFAPAMPIADPNEVAFGPAQVGPGGDAWFGTDALGRDVFARTAFGARISLAVALAAMVFGMAVGGTLGILGGYFKGWLDQGVSFVFYVLLSFPGLVLAILVTSVLERSLQVVCLTLGVLAVAPVGRLARATTLQFVDREFVAAARILGAGHGRIIVRGLLPNVAIPMGALALLSVAVVIVAEGSLAFLGLSVTGEDSISWGKMLVDGSGVRDLRSAPHVVLFPMGCMFLTVLALNFAGDRVRELSDVKETAF